MKKFLVAILILGSSTLAKADEVKCAPRFQGRLWLDATIEELKGAGQSSTLHVKVFGPFLVMDLICTFMGDCVGFVNGSSEATGKLTFAPNNREITELSLKYLNRENTLACTK